VSLLIPFVVAYIAYAWHSMDRRRITPEEISGEGDKY
jgi:cytochrome d ubiquinol oxidase subunit II